MLIYGCDGASRYAADWTEPQFYIGEIGNYTGLVSGIANCNGPNGPCPGDGGCCFNIDAAAAANAQKGCWGYYFMGGPAADANWNPTGYSESMAYQWGIRQGQAAQKNWQGEGFQYAAYVGHTTIFADIEDPAANYGWLAADDHYQGVGGTRLNHLVFDGWFNTLNGFQTPYGTLKGGVYSSPIAWQGIMGSKVVSGIPIWTCEPQVGGCGRLQQMEPARFGDGVVAFYQYSQSCGDLDCADSTALPD